MKMKPKHYMILGAALGAGLLALIAATVFQNGIDVRGDATVTGEVTATNYMVKAPQWIDLPMNYAWSVLGPTAPSLETVTAGSDIKGLAFDNSDELFAQAQFPHTIAITNSTYPEFYFQPHIHFSTIGTLDATHSNVTWRVDWELANINQLWTNSGTASVTVGVTNNYQHQLVRVASITNPVPNGISAIFRCRITRPASASQEYSPLPSTHDVIFDGMDLHIPVGNKRVLGSVIPSSQ